MPKPALAPPIEEEEDEEKAPVLPEIDVALDKETAEVGKELLTEAMMLQSRMKHDKSRMDDIRGALCTIAQAWNLRGLRMGRFGLSYGGMTSRKTLSVPKLIEQGVDPEVIAASYVESKPFVASRFFTTKK